MMFIGAFFYYYFLTYSNIFHFVTVEEVTEVDNLVERKVPAEHMIVDVKEEPKEEFDESFWSNPHFSSIQGYLEGLLFIIFLK